MNKNVVSAVAKRDLRSWFANPASYVFITLFAAASCAALMFSKEFFTNNLANLDTLNFWFPVIAAAFVALATMGMWTSERASGTQELLFTLPATDFELQLGKFLAYVAIYTVSLAFTLVLPAVLMLLGNPDLGLLFANYLGFWLLGVMLVAVSTIGTQLTQSATVAALLSLVACAAVLGLGYLLALFDFTTWNTIGPIGQFKQFARGKLPIAGLLLFGGLTVAFFQLGLALLSRRRWRGQQEGVHGALRFVGVAVASGALTVIGVHLLPSLDTTVERIHSLSPESKRLLAALPADKPVYITAYVSEEVPEMFVQQRETLLNLIDEFDAIGGNAVEKTIVMPQAFSQEARDAEANFGIRAQSVLFELPEGGFSERQMFLGFVVQSGTEEVVTPAIGPAVPLEYELMRSIRTVSGGARKKVGILKTDVEFMGGLDFQTFRQKPRWQIADDLQQQYRIEQVDAEKDYPTDLACLVVPQPSSLQQEAMDRLQRWMLAGNPTLLLEDPMPLDAPGTAADDEKGGMQARMMGGGGPPKGQFAALMSAIGLQWRIGEIVWDLSSSRFPRPGMLEEFLLLNRSGLAADSPLTADLQNMLLLMAGTVDSANKEGFTVTTLLRSADPTNERGKNGTVAKQDLFSMNMFGGMQLNRSPRRARLNKELPLAVRVRGKATDGNKPLDVVYVADLDLIGNQFFEIRRQVSDPNYRFDNVTFVLNCIDSLAGDESLIALRNRRPTLRRLDRVERAQLQFEEKWNAQKSEAEQAAADALKAAEERLQAAVDKIEKDESIDEQAKVIKVAEVRNVEQRRLDLEKTNIDAAKETKLQIATYDRDQQRRSVQNDYRLIGLGLCVLPSLLVGLLMFSRRASRASAIVPNNRKVGGGGK